MAHAAGNCTRAFARVRPEYTANSPAGGELIPLAFEYFGLVAVRYALSETPPVALDPPTAVQSYLSPPSTNRGDIMNSDPAVVADEVRAQVTEVALICNRILATTGSFAHPHAIRNDLMSAIIALELAEVQLSRMLFP